VIVAAVVAVTPVVVTENVALVAPAGIVTLDGTVALAVLEVRVIFAPALGAAPVKVIVPVLPVPPRTVFGLTEIEAMLAARMAKVAD